MIERTHGHCSVPRDHGSLGRWTSYQRERFAKRNAGEQSTMTEEEIEMLESVGFWDAE